MLQKIARMTYTHFPVPWSRRMIHDIFARREVHRQTRNAAEWGVEQSANWHEMGLTLTEPRTAFLLGSGDSINTLECDKFGIISEHYSMALNLWSVFHNFVPNAVALEASDAAPLESLLAISASKKMPTILMTGYKPSAANPVLPSSHGLPQVPKLLKSHVFHYSSMPLLGDTPDAYRSHIKYLLSIAVKSPGLAGPKTSSLERMVFALAVMGAKEIVLCGFDLAGNYFWETKGEAAEADTKLHPTASGTRFRTNVLMRLPVLGDVLQEALEVELRVGHATGLLADILPTYSWNAKAQER